MFNGRNFQPRHSPQWDHRLGRHISGDDRILIGAPVVFDPTGGPDEDGNDGDGRSVMKLATGAQPLKVAVSGLAYWEGEYDWPMGVDPVLTAQTDISYVPANTPFQVWSGNSTAVAFFNTDDETVGPVGVGMDRLYVARKMVDPDLFGATPGIARGAYLTPGVGTDEDGFWAVTTDVANAWLTVYNVDVDAGIVEAQFVR